MSDFIIHIKFHFTISSLYTEDEDYIDEVTGETIKEQFSLNFQKVFYELCNNKGISDAPVTIEGMKSFDIIRSMSCLQYIRSLKTLIV